MKKLAVGSKKLKDVNFTDWEAVLSEIITGDSFGVDRIDYLLRDSYHLGVSYGRFDHAKLIQSLRILPRSGSEEGSREPALGVELNGVHSAEALLLARYFMYEQVYFHHVRRIYDYHLIQFMSAHYGANNYPTDIVGHLAQSDNEINVAMRRAASDPCSLEHILASRVLTRKHFRRVYERNPSDEDIASQSIASQKIIPASEQSDVSAAYFLYSKILGLFDSEMIYYDSYVQSSDPSSFPVLMSDQRIEDSIQVSLALRNLPLTRMKYIFAAPSIAQDVGRWIASERLKVLEGA